MADVLIIDDDFELAKTWQSALELRGHKVTLASSTNEALQHVEQKRFHTVVVDLMIKTPAEDPPDSGIFFLRSIREMDNLPRLIGVSGYYGSDSGKMADSLLRVYGVRHVLLKPFDPQDLVKLI